MKTIERMGAQGDVLFRRVTSIPDGARRVEGEAEMVVAHSETGHHHVARPRRGYSCERYQDERDPLVSYLRIRREGDRMQAQADAAIAAIDAVLVEHERPYDTHETIALGAEDEAIWEVRRQREHTPTGWRQVMD